VLDTEGTCKSADCNPACEADPTRDSAAVINECGVFVSSTAAPGGDGTKARPFRSFVEAANTRPKRVYACAEQYDEGVGVSFADGVQIYAGFTDCGGSWTWPGDQRATLNGPADAVALMLSGGDNRVMNLDVVAASATVDGGSSIAVVSSGGSLAVVNGNLTAGDAMAGAAGAQYEPDSALDGEAGGEGVSVCADVESHPGPAGKEEVCPTGGSSVAGKGGDGGDSTGAAAAGNGGDGAPADLTTPEQGIGGTGEGQGDPPADGCSDGSNGASGAPGDSGRGAIGIGSISVAGYASAGGAPGTNGKPGQGGGGGGGAKGGSSIQCDHVSASRAGSSGGAGGTGGCGGYAGGGGQAGGSSIALVVVGAAVTLEGVILRAGRGGDGGKGGDGQPGGQKGAGGAFAEGVGATDASCRGGDGGKGGPGGPGGGGQGGHSLGIAFQGSTPPVGGELVIDLHNKGNGGLGGSNNDTPDGGKGADGVAAGCLDFATQTSCGG
jgi:hypothetical protein